MIGTLRCLPLCFIVLSVGFWGCLRSDQVLLSNTTEEGEAPAELPGEPVLLELSSKRAQVVRLTEPDGTENLGRLQISSTVAGVMITIDGGEPLPLPISLELESGPHEVNATCPDGSSESFGVSIEASSTVHLHVCINRDGP